MKRALCALAVLLTVGPMARADLGIYSFVGTGLYSNYVFRGTRMTSTSSWSYVSLGYDINSRLSLQGSVLGYTFLQGNNPLSNPGLAEIDSDVSFTWKPWNWVSLTGGWVYYALSNSYFAAPDFAEAYGRVTFNTLPWRPWVALHYDYDQTRGQVIGGAQAVSPVDAYLTVGAGNVYKLGENGWYGEISGQGGFGLRKNGGSTKHGFNDARARLGLKYDLGSGWTIGPACDLWFAPKQVSGAGGGSAKNFRPVYSLTLGYNSQF